MAKRVSVKEIIGTEEEIDFIKAIDKFSCQDNEVANFLKTKAFEFDRRNKSRTYLIVDIDDSEDIIILGYYTITMKSLPFGIGTSKSTVKKIDGFRSDAAAAESILIGQLGKNYNYRDKIDGSTLIEYAMETVYIVHTAAGGRVVFLECSDNEKIIEFYKNNDFVFLQNSSEGKYVQMIRYL